MQRTVWIAISAMIGFGGLTACNKTAKQEAAADKSNTLKEEAQQTAENIKEGAKDAAAEVKEESRQTARDIKEGANEAADKIRDEAAKAADALKAGADKSAAKSNDEAGKVTANIHEALSGDRGKTTADEKLNVRIREAIKVNAVAAKEAGDVKFETTDGHVRIIGTVTASDSKKEIAHVARKVAGLTHVNDDIKVAERAAEAPRD